LGYGCGQCNAHDTLAGNSRWNPAPESGAGFQREFPAQVATKFALVSSASFQRENMADDENAVYYYKNNDVYNIYLQTSRSTKLPNHCAPFTWIPVQNRALRYIALDSRTS